MRTFSREGHRLCRHAHVTASTGPTALLGIVVHISHRGGTKTLGTRTTYEGVNVLLYNNATMHDTIMISYYNAQGSPNIKRASSHTRFFSISLSMSALGLGLGLRLGLG